MTDKIINLVPKISKKEDNREDDKIIDFLKLLLTMAEKGEIDAISAVMFRNDEALMMGSAYSVLYSDLAIIGAHEAIKQHLLSQQMKKG
jgi:hypothetical protein